MGTGRVATRSAGTVVTMSRTTRTCPPSPPVRALTMTRTASSGFSGAIRPSVPGRWICPSTVPSLV